MTNKQRDDLLISLATGLNNVQVTISEMRAEMKCMATKDDLKAVEKGIRDDMQKMEKGIRDDMQKKEKEIRNDMKRMLDEQTELIAKDTVSVIKTYVSGIYKKYENLEDKVNKHDNEINQIKLVLAN